MRRVPLWHLLGADDHGQGLSWGWGRGVETKPFSTMEQPFVAASLHVFPPFFIITVASHLLCLSCRMPYPYLPGLLTFFPICPLTKCPTNTKTTGRDVHPLQVPAPDLWPWVIHGAAHAGRGMWLLKRSTNSAKPCSSQAGNMFTMGNQSLRFGTGGFNLLPFLLLGPGGQGLTRLEQNHEQQQSFSLVSTGVTGEILKQTLSKLH